MEKKEAKIYFPPEDQTKKEKSKQEERKITERRLHALTPGEAEEFVKEAKRAMNESRGIRRAESEKWWFGREKKEWEKAEEVEKEAEKEQRGGAELAKWVFDQLAFIGGTFWTVQKENLRMPEGKLFSEVVEPSLRRLAKEVVEYKAQEDLKNYFWDRWASFQKDLSQRDFQEIWKIWQKYLGEASGGPV